MTDAAPIYVPLDALWLTAEQVACVCDVTRSWLDEFKVRRPDGWRKFGDARNAKVLYHLAEVEEDVRGCVGCRSGVRGMGK